MEDNQTKTETLSNEELRAKLTNKNEQYIFQMERSLLAANFPQEKIDQELATMLPVLVENQKTGLTARQIYGTVTERVQAILAGPVKDPNAKSPDWQIALDGGLLLGGIFALISGVTFLMNPQRAVNMGLITLIINFVVGGLVLLVLSKFAPNLDKPKGERGYGKYLLVSTLAMVVWLFLVMGSQAFVPASMNIAMPGYVYLGIGIVALAAKWYLKKTLQITGTVM